VQDHQEQPDPARIEALAPIARRPARGTRRRRVELDPPVRLDVQCKPDRPAAHRLLVELLAERAVAIYNADDYHQN
jgi:hypothetical protein